MLRLVKYEQLVCDAERSEADIEFEMYKSNDFGIDSQPNGTVIAVGVSIFVLFVVTIIFCFTCSCCCLYKACRRQPRPVVTTTTATTVVQVPYPQQPGMPPQGYPAGMYQGYNPLPVQPQQGMPAAPYPTQYPPPYPTQPAGPPPYHETMAGKQRICGEEWGALSCTPSCRSWGVCGANTRFLRGHEPLICSFYFLAYFF
ncbi:Hypothetical predicted protein [Podarcis lilfordi]|uniref:Protein shisa-5 n=1 Tax=Podarcis lilfordi TaxID=74358 RepID=A0AA35JWK2_9SAUR|nr:Hypothetical predicted protein [Podarcis lilfordi]